MSYCDICGNRLTDDHIYCSGCGRIVRENHAGNGFKPRWGPLALLGAGVMTGVLAWVLFRTPSLQGTVTDAATGDPVTGAVVELSDNEVSDTTDHAGSFVLETDSIGRHIRVRAKGYVEIKRALIIEERENSHVQIELRPVVTIWKVGSPHRNNLPSDRLPNVLRERAVDGRIALTVQTFRPEGFDKVFEAAFAKGQPPDLLVIDNFGVLEGINTELGRFTGIARTSEERGRFMFANEVFEDLNERGGWELLVVGSHHHEAVKAFIRSIDPCEGGGSQVPEDLRNRLNDLVQETIVEARVPGDKSHPLFRSNVKDLLDQADSADGKIDDVRLCSGWGNRSIQFLETMYHLVEDPNEDFGRVGWYPRLFILEDTGREWRIVWIQDRRGVTKRLEPFQVESGVSGFEEWNPESLAPEDGSEWNRFPQRDRPWILWEYDQDDVLYLIESTYCQPGSADCSSGHFHLVDPREHTIHGSHGDGSMLMVRVPFGVGAQPHRWRIWAIPRRSGSVRVTPWRTLTYLN